MLIIYQTKRWIMLSLNNTLATVLILFLTGCASQKGHDVVEYSNTNSHALNIANQTVLSDNTLLRDYTQYEIDEAKTNIKNIKGGNAQIFFGATQILTGQLIGGLGVAGGLATNAYDTNSILAKERWIIAIDADGLTKEQAYNKIKGDLFKAYNKTVNELYNFSGKETVNNYNHNYSCHFNKVYNKNFNEKYADQYSDINNIGICTHTGSNNSLFKQEFNFGAVSKESWTVGVIDNHISNLAFEMKPLFLLNSTNHIESYDEFYQTMTNYLPEGYFYYVPAFGTVRITKELDGKKQIVTVTNLTQLEPVIYTQGKILRFVKPE